MKEKRNTWIVFGLFSLLLLVQTVLFNYYAFRHAPYLLTTGQWVLRGVGMVAASMFWASFAFLLPDKRWLIALSVIIDTWMVANLIYMRNNYILLDAEAFNMSANLHGYFWSVLVYIEWGIDLLFYGLTVLFALALRYIPTRVCSWRAWLTIILLSSGYCFAGNTSILYAPMHITANYIRIINGYQPNRPLTEEDHATMTQLNQGTDTATLDSPLIIVLLESLENWVVTPEIMPNLYRLTQNDHVFYANRIHTQIVGAPSADGQMIVNTGLLPITAGATCLHYDMHTYPAIMKLAPEKAVCLLPHDTCVWNQTKMSPAYGYDSTICYSDVDTILFRKLDSLVDEGCHYIQCITQSTHAPFVNEKYSRLPLPKSMPWVMYNFIRGFNALDDGLGHFIRKIETDTVLQNYTIVITGDHRILHYEKRSLMQRYADKHGMHLQPSDDCLPLIIYSPRISGNPRYMDDCYQMDIYPTYRALVGADDFHWRGFGINLMDSTQKRPISADEAFVLSDKVIRNDYFNP